MKRILSILLTLVMMLSMCSFLVPAALAAEETATEHEHKVEEWTTTKKATCTEPGEKSGVCTVCGETVTKEISPKGHKEPDSWKTIQKPTSSDRTMIKVKYCERCGEECKRQEKTLTKKEYKSWYKDQCKSISYKKLERSPKKYDGDMIKFTGYVFQVIYESDNSLYPNMYFIATDGKYKDLVYIKIYGELSTRILKGDKISVWGKYGGIYTYETTSGASNAIPQMTVEFYNVK